MKNMSKITKMVIVIGVVATLLSIVSAYHNLSGWAAALPYFIGWYGSMFWEHMMTTKSDWGKVKKDFKETLNGQDILYWEQHEELLEYLEERYDIKKK